MLTLSPADLAASREHPEVVLPVFFRRDQPLFVLRLGNVLDMLRELPSNSVQVCVTSPPYFGVRSYGIAPTVWGGDPLCNHEWGEPIKAPGGFTDNYGEDGIFNRDGQGYARHCERGQFCLKCKTAWLGCLGLEPDVDLYIDHLVEIFREVHRVLRTDGICWVNLGDSYAQGGSRATEEELVADAERVEEKDYATGAFAGHRGWDRSAGTAGGDLKVKDLCLVPERFSIAMQKAHIATAMRRVGRWWIRSRCLWHKPNALPQSPADRPSPDHEHVWMCTKSARYWYCREAVRKKAKPPQGGSVRSNVRAKGVVNTDGARGSRSTKPYKPSYEAYLRTIWTINTFPSPTPHSACVDDRTEILTATGWKRYEEIAVGDIAAQYDIETRRASWGAIEGVFTNEVQDLKVFEARTPTISMLVTQDHRCVVVPYDWRTRKPSTGPAKIVRAYDVDPKKDVMPISAEWDEAIGCDQVDEDWAALLGWYIAEGHECNGSSSVDLYQSFSHNPAHVERIRELLHKIGAEYVEAKALRPYRGRQKHQICWNIRGYAAFRLRQLAPGKKASWHWLQWSTPVLRALLQAFIWGDGHTRKTNPERRVLIQKDVGNNDFFNALVFRCGLSTSISTRRDGVCLVYANKGRTKGLRGPNGRGIVWKERLYTGVIWCPKLPLGTWIARRDGKVFITGNTFPPAIPRTCILLSTPPSSCGDCGKPYDPVIEVDEVPDEEAVRRCGGRPSSGNASRGTQTNWAHYEGTATKDYAGALAQDPSETKSRILRTLVRKRIVDWVPGCQCGAEPIPPLVLDIFAGVGTTGHVATELGRRFIGFDLSEEYLEVARDPEGAKAVWHFVRALVPAIYDGWGQAHGLKPRPPKRKPKKGQPAPAPTVPEGQLELFAGVTS